MFKECLDKLSISSRDAVADGSILPNSVISEYLHVDRDIDHKFNSLFKAVLGCKRSQLVLISGNVGDGKSHMLSRLRKSFPNEMRDVKVKNDATESMNVDRTWIEELSEFLSPYNHENIINSSKPEIRIVAINLGVLSNFLLHASDNFPELREYVQNKGIIDKLSKSDIFDADSHFQYINLADYNLFTLSISNANSSFIFELFDKITSESHKNPFYNAYTQYYLAHPDPGECPIRFNYLELRKKNVQSAVIQLLIYVIIKFKLIVSVRDLLNFIYELIVPSEFSNLSGTQIINHLIAKVPSPVQYSTLYNKLFNSKGRSELFDALQSVDPVKYRSSHLDQLIFKLCSTSDVQVIYSEFGIDIKDKWLSTANRNVSNLSFVSQFVRILFVNRIDFFDAQLKYAHDFYLILFNYHRGQGGLRSLYSDVIRAIFYWNGNSKLEGEINVPIGKKQMYYNVTQNLILKADIQYGFPNDQSAEISEFETSLIVGVKTEDRSFKFMMDLNLYILLQDVIKGYCPNKLDRENHINFQQMVDALSITSGESRSINFEKLDGSKRINFNLSFDSDLGYEFKKRNK